MNWRELARLRVLLAKFSESTGPDDGKLRDEIGHIIHAIDERLDPRSGEW